MGFRWTSFRSESKEILSDRMRTLKGPWSWFSGVMLTTNSNPQMHAFIECNLLSFTFEIRLISILNWLGQSNRRFIFSGSKTWVKSAPIQFNRLLNMIFEWPQMLTWWDHIEPRLEFSYPKNVMDLSFFSYIIIFRSFSHWTDLHHDLIASNKPRKRLGVMLSINAMGHSYSDIRLTLILFRWVYAGIKFGFSDPKIIWD